MQAGTINKTVLNGDLTAMQGPVVTHGRKQRTHSSSPFIDQHRGLTLYTNTRATFSFLFLSQGLPFQTYALGHFQ